MRFILKSHDEKDSVTLEFEEIVLDEVLERMASFLRASGYTYVDGLSYHNDRDQVNEDILEDLEEQGD